jgi:predicted XRE-type DNA-binding protein
MSKQPNHKKRDRAKDRKTHSEMQVHPSSGNVFADLGLPDSDKLLAKAELARRIGAIIRESKWDQKQAAEKLGIDQPKISNLIRGKLSDFSIERLMDFLSSLDQDVIIVVRPAERRRHAGLHVVNEIDRELVSA